MKSIKQIKKQAKAMRVRVDVLRESLEAALALQKQNARQLESTDRENDRLRARLDATLTGMTLMAERVRALEATGAKCDGVWLAC